MNDLDLRLKQACREHIENIDYPQLRLGKLLAPPGKNLPPGYNEQKHSNFIVLPVRSPDLELQRQLRTSQPDFQALQESYITVYRVTPQVK